MPSFKSRVLDALNIEKKSIKLPIREKFWNQTWSAVEGAEDQLAAPTQNQYALSVPKRFRGDVTSDGTYESGYNGNTPYVTQTGRRVEYDIGNGHSQTLDYLGFVMGTPVLPIHLTAHSNEGDLDDGPASLQKPYPLDSDNAQGDNVNGATGFHYLGGLYDAGNRQLQHMRKSAITPMGMVTEYGTTADHSHTDWPSTHMDQVRLLAENPSADSLIYHQTRLQFHITGVQRPGFDSASNHRGLVRMLIVRPIIPRVRLAMMVNGGDGVHQAKLRTKYLPNIDTELFYSGKKLLGGRLDARTDFGDNNTAQDAVTFGIDKFDQVDPELNIDPDSMYYGDYVPVGPSLHDTHCLSPFDLVTAPINRKKYKVIVDKTFHLDTQHHGVAATRVENVTIPYHMEVNFAGRKPTDVGTEDPGGGTAGEPNEVMDRATDGSWAGLSDETFDEPLNMKSKPIILFMSLDQKLSVQPTGYTVISET